MLLTVHEVKAAPVISEVMWMGSDVSTSDEWVEIGGANQDTSLAGWTLTSMNSKSAEVVLYRFQTGATIGSDKFLVISNNPASSSRLLNAPYAVTTAMSLPNLKLLLRLRNKSGSIMDLVDDGVGDPFAGSNPSGGPKASMERIELNGSGGLKANWRTATVSRGFDSGALIFGTPGFENGSTDVPAGPSPLHDVTNLTGEWKDSGSGHVLSLTWNLPPDMELFNQLLDAQPQLQNHTGSWILSPGSSSFTASGALDDRLYTVRIRIRNTSGFTSSGSQVSVEPLPKLKISEVLPDPLGSDDAEWIELFNAGGASVDSAGLSVQTGASSHAYIIPSSASGHSFIASGGYLLLNKSLTGLSLTNNGSKVLLKKASATLDTMVYPALPEGVSFGFQPDRQIVGPLCLPTPGSANGLDNWNPNLRVTSGELEASEKTTINFEVVGSGSTLTNMQCHIDFGDGSLSESCNPPPHTFAKPGNYQVIAVATNYCGTTVERSKDVHVIPQELVSLNSPGDASSDNPLSCLVRSDTGLRISELFPEPQKALHDDEWIELENTTSATLDLCGWWLDDDQETGKPYSLNGWKVAPHAFLVLHHRQTKLNLNNSKEDIRLFAPLPSLIAKQLLLLTSQKIDSISSLEEQVHYEKAEEEKSFARSLNGQFLWTSRPTPGEPNVFQSAPTASGSITSVSVMKTLRGIIARVIRVIDGDTFDVAFLNPKKDKVPLTGRIRLIGVDAPESVDPRKPIQPHSLEASRYLKSLIEDKKVELSFDTKNKKDIYGRLLAYASIGSGISLQEQLLMNGLARVDSLQSSSTIDSYLALQKIAYDEKKGIWSDAASEAQVILNEAFPHPPKNSDEWIELYNQSGMKADLSGWKIDDVRSGGSKPYTFPIGFSIDPKSYSVIFSYKSGLKLNNNGDEISLLSPADSVIDRTVIPALKENQSWSRAIPQGTRWCVSTQATPAAENLCSIPVKSVKVSAKKTAGVTSSKRSITKKKNATIKKIKKPGSVSSKDYSEQVKKLLAKKSDEKLHLWQISLPLSVIALFLAGAFCIFVWLIIPQ